MERSEHKAVCKVRKANLAALFTSNNTFQPPPPGCAFPPHKAGFVLASAVVCMKMDFSFAKGMVFKKVMNHQYYSICPLPNVEALVNEVVDLERANASVICHIFNDGC